MTVTVPEDPTVPDRYLAAPSDLAARLGVEDNAPAVHLALRRISDRFRGAVGHNVTTTNDVEWFVSGDGSHSIRLPGAPIQGTPVVDIDGDPVTDFQVGRRSGLLRRRTCWPDGLENIRVVYSYGYAKVPGDIQDAVLDVAELAVQISVGVDSITTGSESVKFNAGIATSGTTQTWVDAVAKYSVEAPREPVMIRLPGILHDDTVTIVRVTYGLPDADGVPTETTTEHEWKGVNVQQASAEELTDQDRETNVTTWRVSGPPPPVPIQGGDRIKWRGREHTVDGEPDNRTGAYRINHTSLLMVLATG